MLPLVKKKNEMSCQKESKDGSMIFLLKFDAVAVYPTIILRDYLLIILYHLCIICNATWMSKLA
jgi:hypothetical protein